MFFLNETAKFTKEIENSMVKLNNDKRIYQVGLNFKAIA